MRQVLTSSVMHAITLKHLLLPIEQTKDIVPFRMLDLGCGFGYSSLLYAKLATLIRDKQFVMIGSDYHQQFIDQADNNNKKYELKEASVKFVKHDLLSDTEQTLLGDGDGFDICTIGFELSMDFLRAKEKLFKKDALIIVPLSESSSRS